mgnify:CR=1 FL=1
MARGKPQVPNADGLTPMQAAYAARRISHPNESQAASARAAGSSPSSAPQRASEWNASVNVRAVIQRALEKAGLNPESLAEKLALDVDAQKMGLTKDGSVVAMGRDSIASVKALELAYRLGGGLDARVEVTHSGAVIVLHEAARDPFRDAIDVTPEDAK